MSYRKCALCAHLERKKHAICGIRGWPPAESGPCGAHEAASTVGSPWPATLARAWLRRPAARAECALHALAVVSHPPASESSTSNTPLIAEADVVASQPCAALDGLRGTSSLAIPGAQIVSEPASAWPHSVSTALAAGIARRAAAADVIKRAHGSTWLCGAVFEASSPVVPAARGS